MQGNKGSVTLIHCYLLLLRCYCYVIVMLMEYQHIQKSVAFHCVSVFLGPVVTVSGCSGNTITDYSSEYKRIRSPNYPKDYDNNVSVDMICKTYYDMIYCLAHKQKISDKMHIVCNTCS